MGPKVTIVVSPASGAGKTTLVLRMARHEPVVTYPTHGIDVLPCSSGHYLIDTPSPANGNTLPVACASILRDVDYGVVVHAGSSRDTLAQVKALQYVGVDVTIAIARIEHVSINLALAGRARIKLATSTPAAQKVREQSPHKLAMILGIMVGTTSVPMWAHRAILCTSAVLKLLPQLRTPPPVVNANVRLFQERARNAASEARKFVPEVPLTRTKMLLVSAHACAALASWALCRGGPAQAMGLPTPWDGIPCVITWALRSVYAIPFAVVGPWEQASALGLRGALFLAQWPLPDVAMAAALAAAAAAGMHCGVPLLYMCVQGEQSDTLLSANVALTVLAPTAPVAVLVALMLVVAADEELELLTARVFEWMVPLILLLTVG